MKVQLAVAAQNLPTEGSHQAVVVWTRSEDEGGPVVLGRTEGSSQTNSPAWSKLLSTPEDLSEDAQLTVHVCPTVYICPGGPGGDGADPAAAMVDLDMNSVIATATFSLSEVKSSYYQAAASFTTQEADAGAKIALHVTTEPRMGKFTLQLAGADLPDTDFGLGVFKKAKKQQTDPFFELYSADTGKLLVRSAVVEDNLNPVWPFYRLDLEELCGGLLDAPIRITLHDKDGGHGKSQYMGQALVSVEQLIGSATGTPGALKHFAILKGGTSTAQGSFYAEIAKLEEADTASKEAKQHLQLVLQALAAERDALLGQIADLESKAAEAQAAAEAVQASVADAQQKVDALTDAQAEVQAKLQALEDTHKELVQKARIEPCTGTLRFQLAATNLPDTDFGFMNSTDPIYQIMSASANRSHLVLRSETIEDNLNPVWKERELDLQALGGGLDQPFSIIISDKDGGGGQDKVGSVEVTINGLLKAAASETALTIGHGSDARLYVKKAELVDVVDNRAAAKQFNEESVQPLVEECIQAAHNLDAAYAELEVAKTGVADAQEAANAAKDAADLAKKALELMEKAAA